MKYITILFLLISGSILAQRAPSLYGTPHAEHDVYYDIKAGDTIFIYATFQYTFGFEGYVSFRFEYPGGGSSSPDVRMKEYLGRNPDFTQNNAWYRFPLVITERLAERFTPGVYQFTTTYWSSDPISHTTYSKLSEPFEIKKKGDVTVGILDKSNNIPEEKTYYDLQGREVKKPRAGLYIYKTNTGKSGRELIR